MTAQPGITLVGLGPGSMNLLTLQAWRVLEDAQEVYLRRRHPFIVEIAPHAEIRTFEDLLPTADSPEKDDEQVVAEVLRLGRRPGGVVYAAPGHPLADDISSPQVLERAEAEGLPVRIVDGMGFLEAALSALGIPRQSQVSVVEAESLSLAHVPTFPTGSPAVIARLSDRNAAGVQQALLGLYPAEHSVRLVDAAMAPRAAGILDAKIENLHLDQLAASLPQNREAQTSVQPAATAFLYVPALDPETSFEAFLEVVAHLRAPEGCPWDREQTHQSLRGSLIEETYEAIDALDALDLAGMAEEFGDLLLLILMQAQIAADQGEFNVTDVIRGIQNKIVHRHPHVFGEEAASDAKTVLRNWERLKAEERAANGKAEASLLDGISSALPALIQAEQYQKRAAHVGFDWFDVSGVRAKVEEEMGEVDEAETPEQRASELGDLLFAVVNLARWYQVDSENALRETNRRFHKRFTAIEKTARQQGRAISELSLDEMEAIWQAAKKA